MKAFCTFVIVTLISCRVTSGQEPIAAPKDVPPIMATAMASNISEKCLVQVTIPKITWEVVGARKPKIEWPKLQVQVDETLLQLTMDYRPSSQISDDAQNRIVDLKGRRLDRDEIGKRLKAKTPVLVSVSGRMPDEFYLQCTTPDTLIVILGVPDSPAPQFLPREAKDNERLKK